MAAAPTLSFSKALEADAPVLVVLVDPDNKAGVMGSAVLDQLTGGLDRAVAATAFSGKAGLFSRSSRPCRAGRWSADSGWRRLCR